MAVLALSLLGLVPSLSCSSDVTDQLSTASEQSGLTLGSINVLTRNYNNQRTGANLSETILTASNVNASQFGKLFQVAVDDQVYAGVLYASQVPIGAVNHNVIYVATVNNSVYAFDADVGGPPLWQKNFNGSGRPTFHTEVGQAACGNNYVDFTGNIGIVGTPVIDGAAGTVYFVTRTVESTGTVQRLRALDITSGAERSFSPRVIGFSVNGSATDNVGGVVTFNPVTNNQRPGLALSGGVLYVGWSSFCDQTPYHGWLAAFDTATFNTVGVVNTSPNGMMAGIWMGGAAPVIDSAGAIYAATGNGDWDGNVNFGESLLKLAPSSLSRTDFFTAGNWASLNSGDTDLASAGPLILPGTATPSIVTGSKEGKVYLMNTGSLGHMVSGDTQILQWFQAVNTTVVNSTHHIHNTPIAWVSPAGLNLYVWGENDFLRAYRLGTGTNARFNTTPFASGSKLPPLGMPGGIMTMSANGATAGSGVIWAVTPFSGDANHATVPGVMYAFNAETLALLFDSSTIADNDMGNLAKYNPPVAANGKVYVGSFSNFVSAYGLRTLVPFNGAPASLPGTIEAENFDYGGEGLAYHDSDTANQGGAYREGGVDLQAATEGAFNVGWTAAGEWLKYSVAISGGNYNISARAASMSGGGSFRIELEDGTDLTGAISVPATNGWQTWATVSKNNVNLPAGNHVLRVFEITAGFNLNNITFTLNASTCTTAADCNDNNPCTVDACTSGSCTHTAGNAGTVCRASAGVCDQAESCTGSSAACPADGLKPAGTVCRAAANQCDVAETCTGSSTACPADALAPNGTACNDGNSGTCNDVCTAGVCAGTTCSSPAFGGTPRSITSTIQAEDFDTGGEGAGYHDSTTANQGGQYRTTEAVDIEATTDTNGGFNVGWTTAGEWMNYSVTVATAGSYKVNLRVASMTAGQTMHLEVDGKNVTGAITVPNTAGWQTWTTATQNLNAFFTAGNHVVRVAFDTISATNGGVNLNWFTFVANPGPFGGTVRSMTSTVQAEDFDLGGEGIAYHDTDAANQGGQYRTTDAVDIEATTDAGGGFNVGWTAATEYMVYTVSNAATVGTVNVRVASTATQTMHVEVDGVNVSGTINVPNTTGWQTWQTVSKTLITTVAAGTHLVRIVFDSGGVNLNWFTFN